jgi:hypothetical protein
LRVRSPGEHEDAAIAILRNEAARKGGNFVRVDASRVIPLDGGPFVRVRFEVNVEGTAFVCHAPPSSAHAAG